ncbi:MAG: iron-containing alcohol dehydrogenase [Desulfobacterales bacterium]|nr:MAG: iron-containing alcohol dehydrogenase [Desulfobacterales bacterium]
MWTFSCPIIAYGDYALEYIAQIQGKKAFIVTDKNIVSLGLLKLVTDQLDAVNIKWQVFDEIEPEPSLATIKKGGVAVGLYQPDWVIGLGGGSCMDAAKAIIILLVQPDLDPDAIIASDTYNFREKAKLMAIPTTSGTGSEATWAIVLTDADNQRKIGLGTTECTPDVAILDPVMVEGMPPQITADTGMDAVCQAIEGYVSTWGTSITEGPGLVAAKQAFQYLPKAYKDGKDLEARKEMQNAAILAGLSFGNSMAGLGHSMGHALGAMYHIPHGRTVGLFLPYTMEYLINGSEETTAKYAEIACFCGVASGSNLECAKALVAKVRSLLKEINQPLSVEDCGIDKTQYEASIPDLIDRALNEVMTMTVSRVPGVEDLGKIFRYAYEGKHINF